MPSADVNTEAAETETPEIEVAETLDLVLGGRVRLYQPKVGYRAGLDAALLAAAIDLGASETALEAGCGPGAALLQVAWRTRNPDLTGPSLVGIERDAAALALARRNIALNGQTARVQAMAGDIRAPFSKLASDSKQPPFDAVFANPPFFDDPASLRGPAPERREAYIAEGGLKAWTVFLLKAARQAGRITLVHRADRLADLLACLSDDGAGSFRIRPVQPFADRPAKRVLVRAVKGGRAPLVLLPPLVLHARDGTKHTPEAEAILRGEAGFGWS